MTSSHIVVFTNMPDAASAQRLAALLVEARLAACVNILPSVESVYRWTAGIERAVEVPLWIKTRADCYQQLEQAIRTHHPDDIPEIIAVPICRGLPAYLGWIDQCTQPEESHYA